MLKLYLLIKFACTVIDTMLICMVVTVYIQLFDASQSGTAKL